MTPTTLPIEPQKTVLAGSALPDGAPAATKTVTVLSAKRTRERLVLISIALVTAAVVAALLALFDFSLPSAVVTGGLVWAALMAVHSQFKKSAEIARLKAELARHQAGHASSEPFSINDETARDPSGATAADGRTRPAPMRRGTLTGTAKPGKPAQPETAGSAPQLPQHGESLNGPQANPRWEQQPGVSRPGAAAPVAMPSGSAAVSGPARQHGQPAHAGVPSHTQSRTAFPPPPPAQPAPVEATLWPGTSLSAADPMRDQWAFRPRDAQFKTRGPADVADGVSEPESVGPTSAATTIDADLEMVQRKIKALADEVNAAEQLRDRAPAPAAPSPAAAIERSIGALKAAAGSMRERTLPRSDLEAEIALPPKAPNAPLSGRPSAPAMPSAAPTAPKSSAASDHELPFDLMIPATAQRIASSDPTPAPARAEAVAPPLPDMDFEIELPPLPALDLAPPPANPRIEAIVAAIENGAMEVFLSPIVALQSHQVSHYDVTVRLKSNAGTYLDSAEEDLQLAGSDVLALFDTARLKRSAALAQRLDAHNKPGSLLSAVNGASITNASFLETFARVYEDRDRISNQLVLTFTQADVAQFSPSAWQALSDMNAFGFRFALSKIDHASMDFADLAQRGFAFLRLDADALLKGLPARDRFLGPDELCKHLAGAGMTLVADTIDDEAVRARVFGFGILYGQGRLFGGARQVKLDPIPAGSPAAA